MSVFEFWISKAWVELSFSMVETIHWTEYIEGHLLVKDGNMCIILCFHDAKIADIFDGLLQCVRVKAINWLGVAFILTGLPFFKLGIGLMQHPKGWSHYDNCINITWGVFC